MASAPKETVLLTGGSGFIASHVLDDLLDHGYRVVVTVRSAKKGERILQSIKEPLRDNTSYVIVEDIAVEGAFDDAVKHDPPLDYVVHTASPYFLGATDPIKQFLDPAIKGTTGILKSIKTHAPSVKRVVITSSSATILSPPNHPPVYNEDIWRPMTWEEAQNPAVAYEGSKIFAEKAAWAFIDEEKPNFTLATINNTYTFGPIQRLLPDLDAMNATNHRIRDIVLGRWHDVAKIPVSTPVFTWVDVRDVAHAHVRAMALPDAAGKRFYTVSGFFSNKRIVDIIRQNFPDLAATTLPSVEACRDDDFPGEDKMFKFDNSRSRNILGLEYTGLEKSIVDTVRSILDFQKRQTGG